MSHPHVVDLAPLSFFYMDRVAPLGDFVLDPEFMTWASLGFIHREKEMLGTRTPSPPISESGVILSVLKIQMKEHS